MVKYLKKLDTKTFIKKAKEIHHLKYDYSLVEYINSKTLITIICPIHGSFVQAPDKHLQGSGCGTCGYEKSKASRTLTQEEFISRCSSVYQGNEFDFSKTIFINTSTKVDVICNKHGLIKMNPQNLLKGMKCRQCLYEESKHSIEDVFGKTKLPSNITLNHDSFTDISTFSEFICDRHGPFMYRLKDIYKKRFSICPECASLEKRKLHEKKYSEHITSKFTLISVINNSYNPNDDSVILNCAIHGNFNPKKASNALKSKVTPCPICSSNLNLAGKNSLGGFNKTRALRGDFDSKFATLYLLKISLDENVFFKIGVTTKKIENRINRIKYSIHTSDIVILDTIYGEMKDIVLMEDFIKTNYSNFLIDTGLDFGGKTETFSIDLLKPGEGLTTLLENFM